MKNAWLLAVSAVLVACAGAPSSPVSARAVPARPPAPPPASAAAAPHKSAADPFAWLDTVHGKRAMKWVHEQDARTVARYASDEAFSKLQSRILEVYDSDARIPRVNHRGKYLYNFWRDKQHPRGLWRRTTLGEYRKEHPHWDVLLDLDKLDQTEGKRWVYAGVQCMKPKYNDCLVALSPDGGDAHVEREFDIKTRSFVKGGFELPVAKSNVDWIDHDHIYVATDFGPGSMTKSSYPRIVKEWTRGTPLEKAKTIYEGKLADVGVGAMHDRTPGFERDFVSVAKDYYHSELYQRLGDKLVRVQVPSDADAYAHREWLVVKLRSPWAVDGDDLPRRRAAGRALRQVHGGRPQARSAVPPGRAHGAGLAELDAPSPDPRRARRREEPPRGPHLPRWKVVTEEARGRAGSRYSVRLQHGSGRQRRVLAASRGLSDPVVPSTRCCRWSEARDHQARAGFFRRFALRRQSALCHLERRHPDPVLRNRIEEAFARRQEPDAALRLRWLRIFAAALLQRRDRARVARTGWRVRRRQHPRRRRVRSALARRCAQNRTARAPTRTSRRWRAISSPARSPHPRTWRRRARATADS